VNQDYYEQHIRDLEAEIEQLETELHAYRMKEPGAGYIYLLRSECGKYTKIGMSRAPKSRLEFLGVLMPFKVMVVATYPCYDVAATEKRLHEIYKDKRLEGEWFSLSDQDITQLRQGIFEDPDVYTDEDRRLLADHEAEIDAKHKSRMENDQEYAAAHRQLMEGIS
jgi:hypothetical protein